MPGRRRSPASAPCSSLRPEMSTVNSDGPPLPPGSRKNISTRPFGAKVGPFVVIAGGEDALARAVRLHHADRELPAALLGEGDEIAARRPHRRRIGGLRRRRCAAPAAARRHDVDLRPAAAVGFEADAACRPASRTARCRSPACRSAAWSSFERRSITKMFELPPCCRLMMTRWPSGEKRGAKVMPGKLPTISRWPVSMLKQIDARIALAERHVGDFLRSTARSAASARGRRRASDSARWRRPGP